LHISPDPPACRMTKSKRLRRNVAKGKKKRAARCIMRVAELESFGLGGRIILKMIRWLGLLSSGLSQGQFNGVLVCIQYWEFSEHLGTF